MANSKSAKKRAKQEVVKRQRNLARRSEIKSVVKKVMTALENKEVAQAQELLKVAQVKISRARGKGLLHKNTAARKIGTIAKRVAAAAR